MSTSSLRRRLKGRLSSASTLARLASHLWDRRRDPALGRVFRSYLAGTRLDAFSGPGRFASALAGGGMTHTDPLQRPREFYMPDLPSAPFLPADPISHLLERSVEAIRAEYAAFAGDEAPTPSQRLVDAGRWTTVPLMRGEGVFAENVARLPRTWALLQKLPLLPSVHGGAYFSVLSPGTHIAPHCGPTNLRVRYHLTIAGAAGARIRCGTEWRTWDEGRCLVLDDSFEHEVSHEGSERRVVLITDCWHPALTQEERAFLGRIYGAWFPERRAGWVTRPDLAADTAPLAA